MRQGELDDAVAVAPVPIALSNMSGLRRGVEPDGYVLTITVPIFPGRLTWWTASVIWSSS